MNHTPRFRVMLRVYADESDLDIEKARQVLQADPSDSSVKSILIDEDEEFFAVEFAMPTVPSEQTRVQAGEAATAETFKSALTWLRARSKESFHRLGKMGLACDFFVEGYAGRIQVDLLRELTRLGIGLWIAPVP